MAKIKQCAFNANTAEEIRGKKNIDNWPVVYIINSSEEAYVGETVNASVRMSQHWQVPSRQRLDQVSIISDEKYNKSVILDLEAYLISLMSSDDKFRLQNSNSGMQQHEYYERLSYENGFDKIWEALRKKNLVEHSLYEIQNSELFKYSPYKALSVDQRNTLYKIITKLTEASKSGEGMTMIVNGGPGTGKTVLAVYLMKLLAERNADIDRSDEDLDDDYLYYGLRNLPKMKIGLVVPMQSLRTTIKTVFKKVNNLNPKMAISPIQVPKERYDLLIVDEAHRLRQRKALSQYPSFDKNNHLLGLDDSGTELDWIRLCSKNQIFFYDEAQSVKPSDIDKERFAEMKKESNIVEETLTSQFRCKGGNEYIDYIKSIFSDDPPVERKVFPDYEIKLFDDVNAMVEAIKARDDEFGLCRTVAGYSWKWTTKNKKGDGLFDIEIDHYRYRWNSEYLDWVNSEHSIDEIGCIHTIQGYDLNYAGVILGNEIKYDEKSHIIVIDKSQYFDLQGKTALKDDDALQTYIKNIYSTLMTRGIRGTYVYACDEGMRKYLSKFINN